MVMFCKFVKKCLSMPPLSPARSFVEDVCYGVQLFEPVLISALIHFLCSGTVTIGNVWFLFLSAFSAKYFCDISHLVKFHLIVQ